MIGYFPSLQPDELLYSAIARRSRHLGSRSAFLNMAELFGRPNAVASFDLPGHLSTLADRLHPTLGMTLDRMIDEATLFPYYSAFQEPSVRARVRSAMASGVADKHFSLGLQTFDVARPRELRFCRACLDEMQRARGEYWWRRAHQLPSAPVCPDHGEALRVSRVVFGNLRKHAFVPATVDVCPDDAPSIVPACSGLVRARLWDLAKASAKLLVEAPKAGQAEVLRNYRERLHRRGLMRSWNKANHAKLSRALERHYGEALAAFPGIADRGRCGPWLTSIARDQRTFHPLHHLLLSSFLDRAPHASLPFGHGPWECLNPDADHCGANVVDRVETCRSGGAVVGMFRCGCGYAYTRRRHEDGRLSPPRFRSHDPSLKATLQRMAGVGSSLDTAAKAVGLDMRSVTREAARLGIPAFEARPGSKYASTTLASTPGALDRDRRSTSKGRSDWREMDRTLADELREAARLILAESPPVRVTTVELERRTRREGYIQRRARLLPFSRSLARELTESPATFSTRRRMAGSRGSDDVRVTLASPPNGHPPAHGDGASGSDAAMAFQPRAAAAAGYGAASPTRSIPGRSGSRPSFARGSPTEGRRCLPLNGVGGPYKRSLQTCRASIYERP